MDMVQALNKYLAKVSKEWSSNADIDGYDVENGFTAGYKQSRIDFAHELHEIGISDLELADFVDTELKKG